MGGIEVTLPEGGYTLRAIATDGVGLDSDCSDPVDVEVDLTRPDPPNALSIEPGTPTNDRTPGLRGIGRGGLSDPRLRRQPELLAGRRRDRDRRPPSTRPTASSSSTTSAPGPHTLTATATDAGWERERCARPVSRWSSTSPTRSSRASPWSDRPRPTTRLRRSPGRCPRQVRSTSTTPPACSGPAVVSGSVASFEGGLAITPALADDVYAFWAQATDLAGNVGACQGPVTVTVDTDPPAAPAIDDHPGRPRHQPERDRHVGAGDHGPRLPRRLPARDRPWGSAATPRSPAPASRSARAGPGHLHGACHGRGRRGQRQRVLGRGDVRRRLGRSSLSRWWAARAGSPYPA